MNKTKNLSKDQRRLSFARPDLVAEWHPTKNIEHHPSLLTIGSGKKVWWQCEHGHEWQSTIKNRTSGSQCPTCQLHHRKSTPYQKRCQPQNYLSNQHPELLKDWHPTKNEGINPLTITVKSNFKIWWQCEHGHEWQRRIPEQIKSQRCPYCTGRLPVPGKTDFLTTHPHLAKDWHPTKNGTLQPQHVTFGSAKLVWWQCEHGHEWQRKIFARKFQEACPHCQKETPLKGMALGIKHPELLNEWHPTQNENLTPFDVSYGSGQVVWWLCPNGHSWQSSVHRRTTHKATCPHCQTCQKNLN